MKGVKLLVWMVAWKYRFFFLMVVCNLGWDYSCWSYENDDGTGNGCVGGMEMKLVII